MADRQALAKSENDKRMWMAHQTQQIIINRLQNYREHPGGELVCLVGFFLRRVDLKENREEEEAGEWALCKKRILKIEHKCCDTGRPNKE